MTEEQLQQAQALIEKYKGKITEGEWEIDAVATRDETAYVILFRDRYFNGEEANPIDISLMSDAPTLLALLEVALKTLQKTTNVYRQASVAFSKENAELHAKIKELEANNDQ